jgi:glycerol-3-phosphate acyltransferase PlsY
MVANEALLHNWFYGNIYVREVAAIGFAFLMGSIPIAQAFHWLFDGLDPRVGRTASALAPVVNTVKAFIPVAIAFHGGGLATGAGAAVAVVAGHCYCPWLRFRGGTGVAVEFGALAGLCPPAAIVFFVLWLVGALLASAFSLVSLWYFLGAPGAFAGVAMFVLIAGAHRASLDRLAEGREPTLRRPRYAEAPPAPEPGRGSLVIMDGQAVQGF